VADVVLLTSKSLGSCLRRSDELIFITALTFPVLIFSLRLCASASKYFIFDAEPRRHRVFISHSCVGRNPVTDVVLLTSKSLGSCLRRSDGVNFLTILTFSVLIFSLRLCASASKHFTFGAESRRHRAFNSGHPCANPFAPTICNGSNLHLALVLPDFYQQNQHLH